MTKFNSGQENFVFSDKIKIHVFQKSTIWHFLRWMCTAKAQKLDVYCKSSKADKKRPKTGLGTLYDILPGVGHPSLSLNILLSPMANSFVRKLGCSLNCAQHQTMITATNKSSLLVLGIYSRLPYNTFSWRHCDQ